MKYHRGELISLYVHHNKKGEQKMSETYSIACKDCEEHLWIAQCPNNNPNRGYVYSTEDHPDFLFQFLWKHKGHNLIFDHNTWGDIAEWKEINRPWDDEGGEEDD